MRDGGGMKCECGTDTKTKDSRKIEQGIWRRRFCPACDAAFTTLEQRCVTLANPYTRDKSAMAAKGKVIAPPVPEVPRPARRDYQAERVKAPWAPPPVPKILHTPRGPDRPPVDHVTPTARDRIEDMKFERRQDTYGWDTK